MTKPDPPPVYGDLEAGGSAPSPYQIPSSTWTSIRSRLPGAPSTTHDYIPMNDLAHQKASDRMLALAASASTEPERIAAMATIPQLLAEEEKTRQAQALEAQKASEESWNTFAAFWNAMVPLVWIVLIGGILVGFFFFLTWVVTLPQWESIQGFFIAIFAFILLGLGGLFMNHCCGEDC